MRAILACLLLAACAGPSQHQLAETPIARTPRTNVEAPPASSSDDERYQLYQQFEDMEDTQEAYREARHEGGSAPPTPLPPGVAEQAEPPLAPPGLTPPKKVGPAVQAPPPVRNGPAVQAP
ncbi:MAG: hypothetical protein SFX73_34440 [Kofleriaceae bacterium]|nr:hypothetical protein [Kofleriaceae bacterium]